MLDFLLSQKNGSCRCRSNLVHIQCYGQRLSTRLPPEQSGRSVNLWVRGGFKKVRTCVKFLHFAHISIFEEALLKVIINCGKIHHDKVNQSAPDKVLACRLAFKNTVKR